jgi:hypothetical protein
VRDVQWHDVLQALLRRNAPLYTYLIAEPRDLLGLNPQPGLMPAWHVSKTAACISQLAYKRARYTQL